MNKWNPSTIRPKNNILNSFKTFLELTACIRNGGQESNKDDVNNRNHVTH